MSIETFLIIAGLSMASTLVIVFFGLTKLRSISGELKLLLALAGVSVTCDAAAFILVRWGISNYSGSVYTLVEFILVLTVYYKAFNNPNRLNALFIMVIVYFLFYMVNLLFVQRQNINSYPKIASSLIFIVLAVGFFYRLIKDLPKVQVYRLPMFWVNVAVLVHFSGNLFVFTLSDYLVTVLKDNLIAYWSFHNFLSIVKNILLTIGFYRSTKPPQISL